MFHVQVEFENNSPDFELVFSSSLDGNPDNESWGVSNLTSTALIDTFPTISTEHITQSFTVGVEPEGWMLTGNTNNFQVTECNGVTMLGGYKSMGVNGVA